MKPTGQEAPGTGCQPITKHCIHTHTPIYTHYRKCKDATKLFLSLFDGEETKVPQEREKLIKSG